MFLSMCMSICITIVADKPTTHKYLLDNGLTLLVRRVHGVSQVAVDVWYNVGSKDEHESERGFAHLLEHMTFKGTHMLSETDIPVITQKLGAACNAATSYDWTHYYYLVPVDNWHQVLPLLADCMRNCTLKDDMLNSELKAVIQELRMNNDQYTRMLSLELMRLAFQGHPYQYPTIGYQQDLYNASSRTLKKFYDQYYAPNNATVVIAGDIDPDEAYAQVQHCFGAIAAGHQKEMHEYTLQEQCVARSATIYRPVNRAVVGMAFTIPGLKKSNQWATDLLMCALGNGRHSRLYKKIVTELQLATSINAGNWELFDTDICMITYEPCQQESIATINTLIHEELQKIATEGPTQEELERGIKQVESAYQTFLESVAGQAYALGYQYTALRDERCLELQFPTDLDTLKADIQQLLYDYYSTTRTHTVTLLPLPEIDTQRWQDAQLEYDDKDATILTAHMRESAVEEPRAAHVFNAQIRDAIRCIKPLQYTLPNGLRILYYHNPTISKITVRLGLPGIKVEHEPHEQRGVYQLLATMVTEGTQNHPGQSWSYELEKRAIGFTIANNALYMHMLKSELVPGLRLLHELVTQAELSDASFKKASLLAMNQYKRFVDSSQEQVNMLANQLIYKNHPWGVSHLLTPELLNTLTPEAVRESYTKISTPHNATVIVVGDLSDYDIPTVIEEIFGTWSGDTIEPIVYPPATPITKAEYIISINRDQTALLWAGLSVNRFDHDYVPLALFNTILSNGISGKLFQLREQTGAFYAISGAGVVGATQQPGMAYVRTLVSNKRLEEVKVMIEQVIATVADTVKQDELEAAQRALLYDMHAAYDTQRDTVNTFTLLDTYDLPHDFFVTRAQEIKAVTLEDVRRAVKRVFDLEHMIFIKAGRVVE